MKEKLKRITESRYGRLIDKFCNSIWYIAAYGVVCIVSHACNIPVVGAVFIALLLSAALVFSKNSFTLIPFLFMCSFVLSAKTKPNTGYFNTPLRITVLSLVLVVVAAALVYNIVYYGKWRVMFKRLYLTISISLLTGAMLVGGVGSPYLTFTGAAMALCLGLATFVPYSLLVNCGEYNGRKTVEYFSYALIAAAMVISMAIIQQYATYGFSQMYNNKTLLSFGHTISNSAAVIVLMSIPMTFYLSYVNKYGFAFLGLVAIEMLAIGSTFSRATMLIASGGVLVVAIALCFKKRDGLLVYRIVVGVAVLAAVAVAIAFRGYVFDLVQKLFSSGNNGRYRIWWDIGFKVWCKSPVFGIGLWYLPLHNGTHAYHSYHCTPLTYLYCGGIVAFAAYVYHRYRTVRLFLGAKLTAERIFVALAVLALLINSLLDVYMTEALHLLYYAVMLALIECDVIATKSASTQIQRMNKTNTQPDDPTI